MADDRRRIHILNPDATYSGELTMDGTGFGTRCSPFGMDFSDDGHLLIGDRNFGRVIIYRPNLEFFTAFGSRGSEVGQFRQPRTVAADGPGRVAVFDMDNYRVQQVGYDGIVQGVFPTFNGDSMAGYFLPDNGGADSDGNFYFPASFRNSMVAVQVLDNRGAPVRTIGAQDIRKNPVRRVHVAPDNTVWVIWTDGTLRKFDSEGAEQLAWNKVGFAEVAVGGDGLVYGFKSASRTIEVRTQLGQVLHEQSYSVGDKPGQFRFASRLAVSPAGLLFISDPGNQGNP